MSKLTSWGLFPFRAKATDNEKEMNGASRVMKQMSQFYCAVGSQTYITQVTPPRKVPEKRTNYNFPLNHKRKEEFKSYKRHTGALPGVWYHL